MIHEGYHREAMGWAMAYYVSSIQIISADAPSALKPVVRAKFDEYVRQFELDKAEVWRGRIEQARAIFREIFVLADEIVARNRVIFD